MKTSSSILNERIKCASYRDPLLKASAPVGTTASTSSPSPALHSPALLLGFPGSGHAYTRQLVEFATGSSSAALFPSKELLPVFGFESACVSSLSVISGFPGDFQLDVKSKKLTILDKKTQVNCVRGRVYSFSKVAFLSRDPFTTLYTSFNNVAVGRRYGIYDYYLNIRSKNSSKFVADMSLQAAYIAREWNNSVVPIRNTLGPNFHSIKFENLLDKTKRVRELTALLRFLGHPEFAVEDRVKCAFALADFSSLARSGGIPIESAFALNPGLTCATWSKVQSYSSNFGYGVLNNTKC